MLPPKLCILELCLRQAMGAQIQNAKLFKAGQDAGALNQCVADSKAPNHPQTAFCTEYIKLTLRGCVVFSLLQKREINHQTV